MTIDAQPPLGREGVDLRCGPGWWRPSRLVGPNALGAKELRYRTAGELGMKWRTRIRVRHRDHLMMTAEPAMSAQRAPRYRGFCAVAHRPTHHHHPQEHGAPPAAGLSQDCCSCWTSR